MFPALNDRFLHVRTAAQQEILKDLQRNLLQHNFKKAALDLSVLSSSFGMNVKSDRTFFHPLINELVVKVGRGLLKLGGNNSDLKAYQQQILSQGASHKTSKNMKIRFNPEHSALLQTLCLQMTFDEIDAGRLSEAYALIEGFTHSEPFIGNALVHGYAGLIAVRVLEESMESQHSLATQVVEVEAAERHLVRAIELSPHQFTFTRALVKLKVMFEKNQEANELVKQFLLINPNDLFALNFAYEFWQSVVFGRSGRVEILPRILYLDPSSTIFNAETAELLDPEALVDILLLRIDCGQGDALHWTLLLKLLLAEKVQLTSPEFRYFWRSEFFKLPTLETELGCLKFAFLSCVNGKEPSTALILATASPQQRAYCRQIFNRFNLELPLFDANNVIVVESTVEPAADIFPESQPRSSPLLLESLSRKELRAELRSRGLSRKGTINVLRQRLQESSAVNQLPIIKQESELESQLATIPL